MHHDSKKLLFQKLLTIALLSGSFITSFAQGTPKLLKQPGYYHMEIGDIDIIALSDGTIPQDLPRLLTNIKPGQVEKLTGLNFQEPIVEASVNAYLVRSPSSQFSKSRL
jgi:hypothetical protein